MNPYWPYSQDKIACEALLRSAQNLPWTIVRPSHTVRTGLPTMMGEGLMVARRMREGRPVLVAGDGSTPWTLTRSEDFARPFVGLFGKPESLGEAFHITSDNAYTWNQIYAAIARALGVEAEIVHVPSDTLVRYHPAWEGPLVGDKAWAALFDNSKVKRVSRSVPVRRTPRRGPGRIDGAHQGPSGRRRRGSRSARRSGGPDRLGAVRAGEIDRSRPGRTRARANESFPNRRIDCMFPETFRRKDREHATRHWRADPRRCWWDCAFRPRKGLELARGRPHCGRPGGAGGRSPGSGPGRDGRTRALLLPCPCSAVVRLAGCGLIAAAAIVLAGAALADPSPTQAGRVQAALDGWLAERGPIEGVTGISAYVSLGTPGPNIEAFAGSTGRGADDPAVDQNTLFAMGSTSKSFAAAVILLLEAKGRLTLDDTVGMWLPEYPAWGDVRIRRLLNMTSGIPNYSETEFISHAWVEEPKRNLTAEELIDAVYPKDGNALPVTEGYHYSNTNYILAGLIAAKAGGKPYPDLVREMILEPHGLHSTFYSPGSYPPAVIARLAHGYFENTACAEYQPPDCKETWNKPLIGRDVREDSMSWAQAAGGAISDARDVTRWMRAVFEGQVVPAKQQAEWLSMISVKTGEPIEKLTPDDPQGFALGLVRMLTPDGPIWFYQGMTLGFRTLYVWFEQDDVLLTVQTNSQPNDDVNELHTVATAIHAAIRAP